MKKSLMLQKRLLNLKLKVDQKISDYIAETNNLAHQLERANEKVSDDLSMTMT